MSDVEWVPSAQAWSAEAGSALFRSLLWMMKRLRHRFQPQRRRPRLPPLGVHLPGNTCAKATCSRPAPCGPGVFKTGSVRVSCSVGFRDRSTMQSVCTPFQTSNRHAFSATGAAPCVVADEAPTAAAEDVEAAVPAGGTGASVDIRLATAFSVLLHSRLRAMAA